MFFNLTIRRPLFGDTKAILPFNQSCRLVLRLEHKLSPHGSTRHDFHINYISEYAREHIYVKYHKHFTHPLLNKTYDFVKQINIHTPCISIIWSYCFIFLKDFNWCAWCMAIWYSRKTYVFNDPCPHRGFDLLIANLPKWFMLPGIYSPLDSTSVWNWHDVNKVEALFKFTFSFHPNDDSFLFCSS